MWIPKVEKIAKLQKTFGESLNKGASDNEVSVLLSEVNKEIGIEIPCDYVDFLKYVNGLEFNGYIFYGIDLPMLVERPEQYVNGLIENNKVWYENEWNKKYFFLGESSMSWYVYDTVTHIYFELDNPSGDERESFASLSEMLEKALGEAAHK